MTRGKFVVVDGIDGVGKGVFLDEFVNCARREGKNVFDVNVFWKENDVHPRVSDIVGKYDVIITSEPTFMGLGKYIREELTSKKHPRTYSSHVVMEAFALDRRILYEQLVLPVLEQGIDVYQSRSFSSSIVYQLQMMLDDIEQTKSTVTNQMTVIDGIFSILDIPGNAFCHEYPMDFLVVPTIKDVDEAMRRAQSRDKQDNSVFENLEFQLKVKQHFESTEFQQIFQLMKVPITYMDAGKTIEFSREQARDFYLKQLR